MKRSRTDDGPACPVCGIDLRDWPAQLVQGHANACLDKVQPPVLKAAGRHQTSITAFFGGRPAKKEPLQAQAPPVQTPQASALSRASAWGALFSKPQPVTPVTSAKQENSSWSAKRPERSCPWYKRMPNTTFTVDAFRYGVIPNCTAYFLSHFHADHYGGLTKGFTSGPIYCSQVTANLVLQQIRVDASYVKALPLDTPVEVEGVQVTLIDANHCPGAVLFLFEKNTPSVRFRYLHTGDFRACQAHLDHPSVAANPYFDSIYLDTTYCKPSHTFPAQSIVVDAVYQMAMRLSIDGESLDDIFRSNWTAESASLLRSWFAPQSSQPKDSGLSTMSKYLYVVGAYTIGKEKVFMAAAKALKSKVFAESTKRRVLGCLEDPIVANVLTTDRNAARVHVVPMRSLQKDALCSYISKLSIPYKHVIAIEPTGWTFSSKTTTKDPSSPEEFLRSLNVKKLADNITLIPLPYSEHSSYSELKYFISSLRARKVIPTVFGGDIQKMQADIDSWKQP